MSDFSKTRIELVFNLSILTTVITIIWFFVARTIGLPELSNYLGLTTILFIASAIISKYGNLTAARVIYMLALNLSVSLTASFIGKGGSVEFVLMFAIGLPFIFFSFRREKFYVALFTILPVILWILLHVTDFKLFTDKQMDPEMAINIVYPFSVISTIVLVTFQLIYFSLLNARYYSKIHNKREEAIEASNAKSQFLSTMSHEIRTPLNAIIGLSYILGDTNPRPDQEQNIEALNYSGKILLNLLNNVLDYSKMESTTIELDLIPTNISEAIKQIKKIHEASCLRKGITLDLEVDENLPIVWLDIVRFNQVINNLVSNAIKFTEKGGVKLMIKKQSESDDKIVLHTEVKDTGIGLTEEQQEKIWDAFTQASSSTNRLYGGTGLGLSIVKSIITAMDSNVTIKSTPGKGSRFYFDIELKVSSKNELEKQTQKKEHDFKGKKILLVEDNLINVMVGKQILEKEELEVDVANDGEIAVSMVKENKYDAILMDIQMPIMDGYTASKEIRKFNTTVPILALSASVFAEVKSKIEDSGMDGFVYKPFKPEDLLNKIEEMIYK
ncbi:Autoinducer 2 sensor kinase/phosphatase LuxQ [Polaribacter huanghezhanensis]|uniref:response regulator n=1 Tax=Polaribacter huanghezhanensis TaxID=1354726 RepID=UPI0026478765|nr:response regulator [Polaribacter huanghezhanensis]WKD84685.1 Autoinducer 2 sensor kinase/phosphatase LuxQ [Polaribacter huanghezhanensis]